MSFLHYILFALFFLIFSIKVKSQYYTTAAIDVIHASRLGREGDMYLDTVNEDYRIGLTNGELARLSDNQNIDSIVLVGDSIRVYIENSTPKAVDISSFFGTSVTVGDIKTGIQTTDHNGWYLLDGRLLLTLPLAAQINAASLGIMGTLPNLDNLIDKTKTGAEALLSTGGNATATLTQANLPAYNLSGTTTSSGNHTHTSTVSTAPDHRHSAEQQGFGLGKRGFTNSNSNKDSIVVKGGSTALSFDPAGKHIHNVTLSNSGNHTHTFSVNSGGSGTGVPLYQPYMVANRFIYLGL